MEAKGQDVTDPSGTTPDIRHRATVVPFRYTAVSGPDISIPLCVPLEM